MCLWFMNNENSGLTKVTRMERRWDAKDKWSFDEGGVRKAFERVYSPEKNYVLFKTVANQEAVDALEQYKGSCGGSDSDNWGIEILQTEGELSREDEKRRLRFSNDLMDEYQHVINNVAGEVLGLENFAHYPMVATEGVHSSSRDPNAIFWPRVYVVDADRKGDLDNIVDGLATGEFFEMLKERESPQFYRMANIQVLNDLGIAPIVRLSEEWRIGAKDLSNCVDFLAQMIETNKWTGPVEYVD